jgi:hypothetical protein
MILNFLVGSFTIFHPNHSGKLQWSRHLVFTLKKKKKKKKTTTTTTTTTKKKYLLFID